MREYTATVYILEKDKLLLIYHKKLQKWLPPGGHLEENELPTEGAIREAKEETGLDIEIVPDENIWIKERPNAGSFERPYLCLLENLPEIHGVPAHQHIDLIYIGRPVGGELHKEHHAKWFSLDEIKTLDLFDDTRELVHHLMSNRAAPSDRAYAEV